LARHHLWQTGEWPTYQTGPVLAAPGEHCRAIEFCLAKGCRGVPGGDTLRRLLARRLGVLTVAIPRLTEAEIPAWADEHHRTTGH
jgi:hypothetical protein